MTAEASHDVPWFETRAEYGAARAALRGHGFDEVTIADALGIAPGASPGHADLARLLYLRAPATPLDTLIRLFLLHAPVALDDAARALEPLPLAAWMRAGVLAETAGGVAARIKLAPYRSLVLAADRNDALIGDQRNDYVMALGQSTRTLADLMVTRRARSALDLGTGCGVLAFLAAECADDVLATDRNPRAVAFARFNAHLNGLPHVEIACGDLFEPARGRRFDSIVANPPFVICPATELVFRDSGAALDGLTRRILREAPEYLQDGGYCQVICNWARIGDGDARDRIAEWTSDTGCDVWAIEDEVVDPARYAALWIAHTEGDGGADYGATFRAWMRFYEEQRITALCAGVIVLRKRAAHTHSLRYERVPILRGAPAGDRIERGFAATELLARLPRPDALLDCRLRRAGDIVWEQTSHVREGSWTPSSSRLRAVRGLGYARAADPFVLMLLAHCDGRAHLGHVIETLARESGIELDDLWAPALAVVTKLLEQGFLEAVEHSVE